MGNNHLPLSQECPAVSGLSAQPSEVCPTWLASASSPSRTSGESPAVLPASRCSGLRLWCEGLRGADKPCQGPLPPTALGMEKGLCYGVRSQQRRGGACTLTSVLAKSKFYLVRKEGGQSQTLELLSSWRRHNRTTTTRPHALLGEPARGEGPTRGELARWPCAGVTEACCSDVRPLGRGKKGVATRFCPFWAIKWSFED